MNPSGLGEGAVNDPLNLYDLTLLKLSDVAWASGSVANDPPMPFKLII
jgi:hypothetical protein